MRVLEYIISAIAPHRCLGCLSEGTLLCQTCEQFLPVAPSRCYKCGRAGLTRLCDSCRLQTPLDNLIAATVYEGLAKDLVSILKFKRAPAAASPMAQLLNQQLDLEEYELVCFVPTATSRVRRRGYDQAALLARELARQSSLPCRQLLARHGQQRQLGQSRAARQAQLADVFRAVADEVVATGHILLIDDVLTTGATLEAAAKALRVAGATHITAAVFAWATEI